MKNLGPRLTSQLLSHPISGAESCPQQATKGRWALGHQTPSLALPQLKALWASASPFLLNLTLG